MNNYLLQLLNELNTIIIPGLGALTLTNEVSGEILFMPYLKYDDGNLAKHISEKEGMDINDAKELILKFVKEVTAELDKGNSYDMYQFGSFKKIDGDVAFEQWNSGKSNEESTAVLTDEDESIIEEPEIIQESIVEEPEIIQESTIVEQEIVEETIVKQEKVKESIVKLATYTINDSNVKPVLEIQKITKPFVGLIKKLQSEPGQMLGIFGTWGRGKTYFVRELCKELNINFDTQKDLIPRMKSETSTHFQFLKFHAWKYQDTEGVWAYLYETIAEKYFKHKNKSNWDTPSNWRQKARFSLLKWVNEKMLLVKLNFVRNGYADLILLIAYFSVLLFILFTNGIDFSKLNSTSIFTSILVTLSGFTVAKIFYKTYKLGDLGKRVVQKYTQRPTFNKLLGIQSEVQAELKHLLKAWIKEPIKETNSTEELTYSSRLLLFVDDVDRCDHDRLIKVVDALRVMLEDEEIVKRVIILLAVDQTILEGAIICKYATVVNTIKDQKIDLEKNLKTIVREYMDKLFISGIQLPQLNKKEQWSILENYANEYDYVRSPTNEESIDYINKEDNIQSSKPKIDDLTIRIVDEESNKVDSANLNDSKLKIYEHELEAIRDQLREFEFCTPRLIRIIIYRFLLAKKIAQEHGIETSEEYNKMLATCITQKTIKKVVPTLSDSSTLEKDNETTNKIIQMVVPY